ncbi:MAG: hypothetical protein ACI9DJ_002782, partial [Algoriphagus sp.]
LGDLFFVSKRKFNLKTCFRPTVIVYSLSF